MVQCVDALNVTLVTSEYRDRLSERENNATAGVVLLFVNNILLVANILDTTVPGTNWIMWLEEIMWNGRTHTVQQWIKPSNIYVRVVSQ